MNRRRFLQNLLAAPAVGYATVTVTGCLVGGSEGARRDNPGPPPDGGAADGDATPSDAGPVDAASPDAGPPPPSLQSYAYYQGLAPDEPHSASRPDGTISSMPCICGADIVAGVDKTYPFWHGHSSRHTFTVTAADFARLRDGEALLLYTSIVDGHRHALAVKPTSVCAKPGC